MNAKKHLSSLICLLLALILACPAVFAEADGTVTDAIEQKTYPYLYCFAEDQEPVSGEMNLYFMNGGDVPYVALTEFLPVLTEMYNTVLKCDKDNPISFELQTVSQPDGDAFIVKRPDNESTWIIQPGDDTLTFTNYGSSRLVREIPLVRECACGRTRGLSDRPLDSFGAVPLNHSWGIVRFLMECQVMLSALPDN